MKIKKLRQTYIRYSFILMCILTSLSSWAGDYVQDGIQYKIYEYNSKAVVVGVDDPDIYEVKIEESVCGYPVTGIATGAFSSCTNLCEITIPSSVTSIAKRAFEGCYNLNYVTITSSTDSPYKGLSIGDEAFSSCTNLTEVTINSPVSTIGERAFNGCEYLKKFTIASSANSPNEYISIGTDAFAGCKSLESFTSSVVVADVGNGAFAGCTSLSSFVVPSGEDFWYLGYIGDGAFENCTSLSSFTIPLSVRSIGSRAFEGCTSLSSVTIPSSVEIINGTAFENCTSLSSVTIPSSVKSIDGTAFNGCSSLTSFDVAQENPNFSSFMGTAITDKEVHKIVCVVKNIKDFIFPSSVTSIGDNAFSGCSSLTSVTIPSSVTSIGDNAFSGCSSLTSVTIPSSVTSIGGYAFYYCSSLTSVTIPSSVTSIGGGVFYGCSSLTSVTIPSSVTSIGDNAFRGCSSLTSVTIPSSVTSIEYCAFQGCSSLTSVTIPSSVTSIGYHAFDGCSFHTSVYFYGNLSDDCRFGSGALGNPLLVMFDCAISEDSPWYDLVSGKRSKVNDYCAMYFGKKVSEEQEKLTDDYLKAKELAGSCKEEYEGLKENQRKLFDGLVNPAHLIESLSAEKSVMTAYNDSLLQAYDMLLEKVNENWYNPLNTIYKQVVQTLPVEVKGSYNDNYSAYDGLITDASQLSSNAKESIEGSYEGLIDNDRSTFFHSEWSTNVSNGAYHYLQIDLRDTYENIVLKYSIRTGYYGAEYYITHGSPKLLHVYVTNTVDDENSWVDLGQYTCTYDYVSDDTGLLNLDFAEPYRYVRLVVEETMNNEVAFIDGKPFFYWSELHAYPKYQASVLSEEELAVIAAAKSELNSNRATKQTYQKLQTLLDKLSKFSIGDFSKSSYLTLYSDKALTVPEGMKAAVVVSNGNGISSDYRYEAGSVIPAHTGVLIKGGKGNSFIFAEGETTEACPADNLLHGTLADAMTEVDGDNKYYKLAYDNATHTQLGFYWGATDGAPFVNKAGKAYLAVPVATSLSQSMQGFSLSDLNNGMTTGLTVPTTTSGESVRIYDLNGRRINDQSIDGLQPGIYVVNGKKMYVK